MQLRLPELWTQQGAQPAILVRLPLCMGSLCFIPWETRRVTLPLIKALGCWPGSCTHLPKPRHWLQGTEPQAPVGVQGRDAGGIASFANASEGGQVLAGPTSEAAPPCQHSWREVPDSLALRAKSEHTAALPSVPWATETAVLSPHILPGVPSMVQLRSLQHPASCWHGPCSSSATGNSGAMGTPT